jgi:hypothetical protein
MRRLCPGFALAALLFAGSFGARAHDFGHEGGFGYLVPGMATGCFGEQFPMLQLVPPPGYGDSAGYGYGDAWSAPYGWEERVRPGRKGIEGPGGGKGIERPGGGKGIEKKPGGKTIEKPGGKEIEKPGEDELELPGLHHLMSRNGAGSRGGLQREAATAGKLRRAGGANLDLRGLTAKDAERLFWLGCKHYWQGDLEEALAYVEAATELFEDDARFWYYRALSESALGQEKRADESLRRAVELHLRGLPAASAISQALERVQGEPRMRLREALNSAR